MSHTPSTRPLVVGEAFAPSTSIPLRRTPPVRQLRHALLLIMLGVFPAVLLPAVWFWWSQHLSLEGVGAVLVLFGVASMGWLAWLFALPPPTPITIDDDVVDLPLGRRRLRIALPELLVARLMPREVVLFAATPPGQAPRGHVGGLVIPRRCFANDDGALQLVDAIRTHLRTRHGEGYVERLDANEQRQRAFQSRRPIVVQIAGAACAVVFGLQLATDAGQSVDGLVAIGANASSLVMDGALWRLVTANLLHGSLLHLGMNLAALLSTGALVERWLGRQGMTLTLIGSGVVGQLMSALVATAQHAPRVTVGISGAVFGILGVLLVSTVRFRKHPTGGLRVPAMTWVLLLATNGALSLIPMVDVAAHVGGFVAGAAVALVTAPRPGAPAHVAPELQRRLAVVAVVVVVLAVVRLLASLWS